MRIQKFLMVLIAATLGMAGLSACSIIDEGGATDRISPQGYVTNAASADSFEIASSQLALNRSRNPEIRDYAEQMIEDHQMSGTMLMNTIVDNNLRVVMPVKGRMLPHHRAKLAWLQDSRDEDFDRNYVKAQAGVHSEAVALHQNYADNGGNTVLAQNAVNVLPHIVMHREEIIDISNGMLNRMHHAWPFGYRDLMIWRD